MHTVKTPFKQKLHKQTATSIPSAAVIAERHFPPFRLFGRQPASREGRERERGKGGAERSEEK